MHGGLHELASFFRYFSNTWTVILMRRLWHESNGLLAFGGIEKLNIRLHLRKML